MTPTEEILKTYEQTNSIDGTQKATGFSWQRIAKTLASNGIIANETQALIIGLYEDGKSMEEIQKCTGFTLATIHAYLPRVRPAYGENQSENAKRIKMWREKTKKKYV